MELNKLKIFRVELEGLKSSVMHYMNEHQSQINEIIRQRLEETLTEEWAVNEINQAVDKCLHEAAYELSKNWELKDMLTKCMISTLRESIEKPADSAESS